MSCPDLISDVYFKELPTPAPDFREGSRGSDERNINLLINKITKEILDVYKIHDGPLRDQRMSYIQRAMTLLAERSSSYALEFLDRFFNDEERAIAGGILWVRDLGIGSISEVVAGADLEHALELVGRIATLGIRRIARKNCIEIAGGSEKVRALPGVDKERFLANAKYRRVISGLKRKESEGAFVHWKAPNMCFVEWRAKEYLENLDLPVASGKRTFPLAQLRYRGLPQEKNSKDRLDGLLAILDKLNGHRYLS